MNMVGAVSQFAGIYRERAPDAALREHVRCVWVNDLTGSQNDWIRVVPDGCVDIVWTGTSLIVAGPDTRSILDRLPRGTVVGARFHPGAALSWLGVPLSLFGPADYVFGFQIGNSTFNAIDALRAPRPPNYASCGVGSYSTCIGFEFFYRCRLVEATGSANPKQ